MTEDTKMALERIRPIAEALGVSISADDKFLYLNNQAIGISCNSVFATIKEFIGYMIVKYSKDYRNLNLTEEQLSVIQRYWYSEEEVSKIMGKADETTI